MFSTLEILVNRQTCGIEFSRTFHNIPTNIYIYRKGRSTESALYMVPQKIESASVNKQSVMAAFIEIEGTYFIEIKHTEQN